jgi:hypothetical protein
MVVPYPTNSTPIPTPRQASFYHLPRPDPFKLQENSLAAIRVLSKRYAEVDKGPFIASITITPIAKAAAGKG